MRNALILSSFVLLVSGCQVSMGGGSRSGPSSPPPPPPPNAGQPGPGPAPAPAPAPAPTPAPAPMPKLSSNTRFKLPSGETVPVISGGNVFGGSTEGGDTLRGFIYFIPPGTQRIPDLNAMKPAGALYTRTIDIPARSFREGFPGVDSRTEWFAIRYEGNFTVAKAGPRSFRLRSDDGSILFIDDVKRLDNDGLHGPSGGTVSVDLAAGAHKIRLDYFQGPADQIALQLFVAEVDRPERPFTTTL